MESTGAERNDGLSRLVIAVFVVALALTVAAPLALGRGVVLGVAVGGLFAVSNLWAIGATVRAFVRGAGVSWGAFAAIKFGALVFLFWIVLRNGWAQAMPLALGYAALPLGLVAGQLTRPPARQKV